MPAPPMTFALLGLLSLQPWTTYELARQSERSLRWFFPRAERAVYQEAKRLVDFGWAQAEESWTGRRKSTTYRITAQGGAELRSWLGTRGAPAQLESEALMQLFFAGPDGIQMMRSSIEVMREDAIAALGQLGSMAAQWESGQAPFPKRGPTNAIPMRLVTDLHRTIAGWADWADAALDRIAMSEESARQLADEVNADVAKDAITVP